MKLADPLNIVRNLYVCDDVNFVARHRCENQWIRNLFYKNCAVYQRNEGHVNMARKVEFHNSTTLFGSQKPLHIPLDWTWALAKAERSVIKR
jgi:hypothetical protein